MMHAILLRVGLPFAVLVLAWSWHAIDKKTAVKAAVQKIEAEHIASLKEAIADYRLRSLAADTRAIAAATNYSIAEARAIETAEAEVQAELEKMKSRFKAVWPAHVVKALNK